MKYLFVTSLVYILITSTATELRGPKWGDTKGTHNYEERVRKGRIPFIRRSTIVEYPVNEQKWRNGEEVNEEVPSLRGMEHVNLVNKTGCGDPDVIFMDDVEDNPPARIKITTKRGCPMDSIIYFYLNELSN